MKKIILEQAKTKKQSTFSTLNFAIIVLISLVGIICYFNTLHGPFVFDDIPHIVELKGIHLDSFSSSKLASLWEIIGLNGRPVALFSLALNYYFGGLNTFGYHLVNLLVHLLTAIFVYLFLNQTLSLPRLQKSYGKYSREIALLCSLLFVVHPIQTQAVSYIIQRMSSMAALFFIVTLYYYGKARLTIGKKRVANFIVCILAALLAFGSKQNSITLPFFIVLYEYFFWQRLKRDRTSKKLIYTILGLVLAVGLMAGIYAKFDLTDLFKGYQERPFTPGQRMLTQFRVVIFYISLLIAPLPSRLNLDHHFSLSYSLLNPPTTLLCFILILALIASSIYLAKKRPLISFALIWFWGNLVLESSILPLVLAFEHRLYLPSVGFFLLISIFLAKGFERLKWKHNAKVAVKSGLIIIFIVPLSIMTYQRNKVWQDKLTLWEDAVKKSPNKARPHLNLGYAYAEQGRQAEAISQYKNALEIDYERKNAHNNLGNIYLEQSKIEQAINEYLLEIKYNPDNAKAYYDLGYAYTEKGRLDEAITQYQYALNKNPRQKDAHNNLGKIYILQNNPDKAIAELIEEIKHYPKNAKAYYNLGLTFVRKGLEQKALLSFQHAVQAAPDFADAHRDLGILYLNANNTEKAIFHFETSLALNPQIRKADKLRQIIKEKKKASFSIKDKKTKSSVKS